MSMVLIGLLFYTYQKDMGSYFLFQSDYSNL